MIFDIYYLRGQIIPLITFDCLFEIEIDYHLRILINKDAVINLI